MEPTYPAVLGRYVNLGEFYDHTALRAQRAQLLKLHGEYRASYSRAYRCLHAAKEVRENGEAVFLTSIAQEKLEKRVRGILGREAKKQKGSTGGVSQRFLSGLTCRGELFLEETVCEKAKRIYEIQDYCGLASEMLWRLEQGFAKSGYQVIAAPSPHNPEKLAHLLIPGLSLAFVTTLPSKRLTKRPYRCIRTDSLVEKEVLQRNRSKLRFAHRIADGLVEDGVEHLRKAKEYHDKMEELYHPHVNFRGVDKVTKLLLAEIRSLGCVE